jgi:hypothetical protein
MVQIDKNLAYKRESHTASFTILMWNFSKDELISELKHKLALISTIKNTFRKTKLNDRLYSYLTQIEKSSIQTYSQIVLIGSETHIYKLDNNDISILKEYSIPKFSIQNDEYFNISWLIDLFENFKFYDIIINDSNSNTLTHWQGNLNKKKIIKQNVNTEYIKNLTLNWFMVGKLQLQNKTKYLIANYPNNQNNMSWSDIIGQIEILEMKKKIEELDKHFENIAINSDKYIFGLDDVCDMIYQYNIKELYIHEKIKSNFNDKIIEKDLSSNINFNIIYINSIDNNLSNGANLFLKNYSGIIGIKYY